PGPTEGGQGFQGDSLALPGLDATNLKEPPDRAGGAGGGSEQGAVHAREDHRTVRPGPRPRDLLPGPLADVTGRECRQIERTRGESEHRTEGRTHDRATTPGPAQPG